MEGCKENDVMDGKPEANQYRERVLTDKEKLSVLQSITNGLMRGIFDDAFDFPVAICAMPHLDRVRLLMNEAEKNRVIAKELEAAVSQSVKAAKAQADQVQPGERAVLVEDVQKGDLLFPKGYRLQVVDVERVSGEVKVRATVKPPGGGSAFSLHNFIVMDYQLKPDRGPVVTVNPVSTPEAGQPKQSAPEGTEGPVTGGSITRLHVGDLVAFRYAFAWGDIEYFAGQQARIKRLNDDCTAEVTTPVFVNSAVGVQVRVINVKLHTLRLVRSADGTPAPAPLPTQPTHQTIVPDSQLLWLVGICNDVLKWWAKNPHMQNTTLYGELYRVLCAMDALRPDTGQTMAQPVPATFDDFLVGDEVALTTDVSTMGFTLKAGHMGTVVELEHGCKTVKVKFSVSKAPTTITPFMAPCALRLVRRNGIEVGPKLGNYTPKEKAAPPTLPLQVGDGIELVEDVPSGHGFVLRGKHVGKVLATDTPWNSVSVEFQVSCEPKRVCLWLHASKVKLFQRNGYRVDIVPPKDGGK